jgi:hypothetical protein
MEKWDKYRMDRNVAIDRFVGLMKKRRMVI